MRTLVILVALALVIPATDLVMADDAPERPKVAPEVQKLVDDLSSDDFRTRERASVELETQGEAARTALAWAAEHDDSLEARFRAQQLLRRLDGQKATPLGEPERPVLEDEDEAARLARELQKRFFGRGGGLDPFFRGGLALGTVRAPGLTLVPEGLGRVRLEVADESQPNEPPTVHRGATLDEILAAHPELTDHPGMAELQAKLKDPLKQLEEMFKGGNVRVFPGQGFNAITSSNGLEIHQTPEQTTVKITEKDENGNDVVKEYTGKDIEEIKREHPELKDKLDGVGTIRFGFSAPQIFGNRRIRSPFDRQPAVTPRAAAGPVLGVHVETPQEALAVHLGLETGHAALVKAVERGSIAETMGIQRNDIIVEVNETPITTLDVLSRLFRAAAAADEPLTVDVIRRGQPLTLTR